MLQHEIGDAWVLKTAELTVANAKQHHTKTHLAHLLSVGDTALGFDFANANVNDENLDAIKPEDLPDVVNR